MGSLLTDDEVILSSYRYNHSLYTGSESLSVPTTMAAFKSTTLITTVAIALPGMWVPNMCKRRHLICHMSFLLCLSTIMSRFSKIAFTDLYINHLAVTCPQTLQTLNTCDIQMGR
jgi:hypothetical protein